MYHTADTVQCKGALGTHLASHTDTLYHTRMHACSVAHTGTVTHAECPTPIWHNSLYIEWHSQSIPMARDYTWPMHMALLTPYNILKESFIYIVIHTRQSIVHMHIWLCIWRRIYSVLSGLQWVHIIVIMGAWNSCTSQCGIQCGLLAIQLPMHLLLLWATLL